MNLDEAHDLIDMLLDKVDQPYFTDDEKNMFIDQAISAFINGHYQFYEQEQVSRDALASFIYYKSVKNNEHYATDDTWEAGIARLPDNYVHLIQISLVYKPPSGSSANPSFEDGNQAKIVGVKDFYDRLYSSDPFNKATKEDPIAYVRQDATSAYIGFYPTIPASTATFAYTGKYRYNCLVFKDHSECFNDNPQNALKELYQREIIDITVRKMIGNIEGAGIQFQQIETEQSKPI